MLPDMPEAPAPVDSLAERLKVLRRGAGLSRAEVATRIGAQGQNPGQYLRRLESGRVRAPGTGTVIRYVRACGGSVREFFAWFDRFEPVKPEFWPMDGTKLPARARERIRERVSRQVRRFERNARAPRSAVEHFAARRVQAEIVEQAVEAVLAKLPVGVMDYVKYKSFVRALGRELRRCRFDARAPEFRVARRELIRRWSERGCDAQVLRKVGKVAGEMTRNLDSRFGLNHRLHRLHRLESGVGESS